MQTLSRDLGQKPLSVSQCSSSSAATLLPIVMRPDQAASAPARRARAALLRAADAFSARRFMCALRSNSGPALPLGLIGDPGGNLVEELLPLRVAGSLGNLLARRRGRGPGEAADGAVLCV